MVDKNVITLGLLIGVSISIGHFGWLQLFGLVLLLAIMFLVSLYKYQENLLYQPQIYSQFIKPSENPPGYQSPKEYELSFENVNIKTEDGLSLHAWFIHQPDSTKSSSVTILFFHANAGNMGFRLPNLKHLYDTLQANILILSYRGYGESEGIPTEEGLVKDSEAAWRYLKSRKDINHEKLIIFGRSLGGAVAISLAAKCSDEICGLIVENTFTCISDMVDQLFPLLKYFKKYILRLDWSSYKRIRKITAPILFLSGLSDEVVPSWQMQRLYECATSSKKRTMVTFLGGKHNDTWMVGNTKYTETLQEFTEQITSRIPNKPNKLNKLH